MSRRWVLGIAVLALTACGGHAGEEETAAASVGVRTAVVEARAFPQSVSATGVVTPRPGRFVSLSAPGPARVARVLTSPGQRVRAGDTLVTFERASFEAAARSAEAAVTVAQSANARAVRLVQAGVLPRKDVDQSAADLAAAQSAAVTVRRALDLAELRSPIAGVVTTLNAVVGQSADMNQVLVEVADPEALDVVLSLTADAAARVRPGATVEFASGDAASGASLGSGIVLAVGAVVDSVQRTVAVRAHVTRAARTLRIGEAVAARIIVGVHQGALAVPTEALVPDGDAFKVFVVDSAGLARARTVVTGARTDSLVEITDGLKAGETVVTYGAYGLDDSVKVVRATP